MIFTICIFALAAVLIVNDILLNKRINGLEDDMYTHLEETHYKAIKNEFSTVWEAIEDLRDGEQ